MKVLIFAAILALALGQASNYPPIMPDWPDVWQFQFTEEWSSDSGNHYSYGNYSYNWTQKSTNNFRANGQWDAICGTIFVNESTACAQLVVPNDVNRYVYFPEKNYCCSCCNTTEGCGSIKPSWGLIDNQYIGDYEFNGTWTTGWLTSDGGYYYQTLNNWPYVFYRGGQDTMNFDQSSFSNTFNSNVFNLPSICNASNLCNGTCTFLQSAPPGSFRLY